VVAVEPELCPTFHAARLAGGPVVVDVGGIAASALGASRLGHQAWMASHWIDESLLVSDDDLTEAQTWLWETCRVLAEPAACAPIAALLTGSLAPAAGERVVALISGANTAPIGGASVPGAG
jgi:threonine dehydratase